MILKYCERLVAQYLLEARVLLLLLIATTDQSSIEAREY